MKSKIVAERILRALDLMYEAPDVEKVSKIIEEEYEKPTPPDITPEQRDLMVRYLSDINLALAPTAPWVN